jgi:16S rRNA (cytosine967-C5)-methyltransferase
MTKRHHRAAAPIRPAAHPGLPARRRACDLVEAVLVRRRPLDEALDERTELEAADRALARKIAATTLRRLGTIDKALGERLAKGLPDGLPRLETTLRTAACQILFLDVPDYAAVDSAVRMVEANGKTKGFAGLTNAVLRGIGRDKADLLAALDPLDDLAVWLRERWIAAHGEAGTRAIARIIAVEPPLDLTVKSDPEGWAQRLGGMVTPTGSVRLKPEGAIPALPGFADGEWWVQDAAAALPARLLGDVRGLAVADLCAAPGGKTAQLAVAGARVTAVDRSPRRLERLAENMTRLKLDVTTLAADAAEIEGQFDAILVDAPCTATGTVRGNPDVLHLKSMADIEGLGRLQARLLDRLGDLLKPGGRAVYCTCSLEPEEGENQIAALLARDDRLVLDPIRPDEIDGIAGFVTPAGHLRTLPSHWPAADDGLAGLDGFFAARLLRRA